MTKYMVMHKADPQQRDGELPTPELIANVGQLVGEVRQAGRLVDAAGLRSSAHRVRVRLTSAGATVLPGPYVGENELVSGCAMLKVSAMDEAIRWGSALGRALGADELEIGTVTEPWDLGMMEKPSNAPLQVLAFPKSTREDEGPGRTPERQQALDRVLAEMRGAGVLVSAHSLGPSARAVRIRREAGGHRLIDGPFAESKELIGGFMLVEFDSREDALAWAKRYADVVGTHEVDVREGA